MAISTVGIDLAKTSFEVYAVNERGEKQLAKTMTKAKLIEFIANLPPCTIAMEACSSSHHFARTFMSMGHQIKMIAPQFVKPFVKGQKNDRNDAEAIVECSLRPRMNFVKPKTIEQQDIQFLHRVRQRLVKTRTELVNETRGGLLECGIAIPVGVGSFKKQLPVIIESADERISAAFRSELVLLLEELYLLEKRIETMNEKIKHVFNNNKAAQRIEKIEGVGVLTATAIVAAAGDAKQFKNSRQFAAWLGLVPRQNSTGGKTNLLGITKNGDSYIRTLLIHGGRSVVRASKTKTDRRSMWVKDKELRRGKNRAAVAVANKNARIIWKLLTSGEEYKRAI